MKKQIRIIAVSAGIAGAAVFGIVSANASGDNQTLHRNVALESASFDNADHPECYDSRKMNDPADFCYQNIGLWNSTAATVSEVRQNVSLESMIDTGMPVSDIQKYYPEYSPAAK